MSRLHHGLSQVYNVCFQFPNQLKIMDCNLGLFSTILTSFLDSTFAVKSVVKREHLSSPIILISIASSKYHVVTDDIFVISQGAETARRTLDPILFPNSLTVSSSLTSFNTGQSSKPIESTYSRITPIPSTYLSANRDSKYLLIVKVFIC